MIRASAKGRDGKPLLILGLTDQNIERLKAGQPVHVAAGSVEDGVQVSVVILHGPTEHHLMNTLRGFIGLDTRMRLDPRLGDG